MSLHAPEPWKLEPSEWGRYPIIDANAKRIGTIEGLCYENSTLGAQEIMRSIACVNCLAGIPANDLPAVRKLWLDSKPKTVWMGQEE